MNTRVRKISYYLYQHTRIFKIFQSPHIDIFLKRIHMLKILCQNYICPCPKHFAITNHLHTFEVFYLTYKFLLFHSHFFIHTCTLESQSHVRHTLAFEKEISCHLYTLEGQFHIIYLFGKHPRAIFDTGTFFF